jgi:gluconate 2-dehydrogenase alpha chain
MFADAARACGYHPFPLPAAILTAPFEGRHACTYCSFCSRFGCHVDAKASAQNTVLPKALATGRLTILTGARVMEIVTENGAATGVVFLTRDGRSHVQHGRTVVVATYAFENTRLLLLSTDEDHPNGLGNNTDQVGRHYLTRQQPSVHAVFDRPVNRFIGPTAQAMAIADLSCDHFDHDGLDFIRGGRIAAFNQYLPIEASGALPPDVPRYGKAWRDFFVSAYSRTAMLFIDPEILPSQNNRLDLDPDIRDAQGRPVVRITFDVGENEKKMIPWVQDRAVEIAEKMGAVRIWRRPVLTGPISTHDTGGTRMGDDPATSVTDGFGRVHDTPNLVVIGGSSFVSLPPVNPALTILALSLRAADRILADQEQESADEVAA